jgi:hypothetical protein
MRDGLLANIWYVYNNDSYFSGALIDPGDVFAPRPSYFAYRHAAQTLGKTRYLGVIPKIPADAEGYRFAHIDGHEIWTIWSDYQSQITVKVPATAKVQCTLRDGASYPCTNKDGTVTLPTLGGNSLFIEIR